MYISHLQQVYEKTPEQSVGSKPVNTPLRAVVRPLPSPAHISIRESVPESPEGDSAGEAVPRFTDLARNTADDTTQPNAEEVSLSVAHFYIQPERMQEYQHKNS